MVLLVDSSGSIQDDDPNNWPIVKDLLKNIISRIPSLTDVQVGVVTFSTFAESKIRFEDHLSRDEYFSKLSNLSYQGGSTNTSGGFRQVRTEYINSSANRPSVRDLVIILTDGIPTLEVERLPEEVRLLLEAGVTIIGIGVTRNIDFDTLRSMVSTENDVFLVEQFDQVASKLDSIISQACVVPTTSPATEQVTAAALYSMY